MLCDICALLTAWQVTAGYGDTFHLLNDKQYNLLAIAAIIAFQVSLLASKELYQAGDKRRNYLNIAKTLTLAHLLLLLITFFLQISNIISQQSFLLSWASSIILVCSDRYILDLSIKYFRQQGVLRYPIYLISHPEDKAQAIALLEKEQRYHLTGWADVNNIGDGNVILQDIYRSAVTDVFICAWEAINSQPLLYRKLKNAGINLHILPKNLGNINQNIELEFLGEIPSFKDVLIFVSLLDFFCCYYRFIYA